MAFLEWRRFNFFDLKKSIDSQKLHQHFGDVRITASSSGRGLLVLADSDGNVHLVSRNFDICTFRAYDRNITIVEQGRQSPFLVTIGEDEVGVNPVIKVWNVEKLDRQSNPTCVRISRAHVPNKAVSTSCLCLNESLTLMAVGFIDGSVIIYQGDVTRERTNKQQILKEGSEAVTGLAFQTSSKDTFLFVATTSSVYFYSITPKDRQIKVVLDTEGGCAPSCCILAESMQDTHLMIAKNDAVYCYTTDGRGPCYAVEGEKILLQWYRSYLIIIARESRNSAVQSTKVNEKSDVSDREKHILTVLDIQNKFIVFTAPMRAVSAVLVEWGSLYVLTGDHTLSLLVEKDLQSKLALLFKKNLYDVSIRIAKNQQYDTEGLVDIFRQYGDHLYSKGDHNAAIEQYIKTIGKLEPSYVIRKFLQSHQIDNLTDYLQALHKQGVATADHTTLLLNCYTKLNKIEKFKEFIMTKDREVDFDVEVAINVCRQTSSEDALLLAEKHNLHSWYLKILIEDHAKYGTAVEYIGKLQFAQADENMKKFGNILLQNAPKEATEFLKRLCTNYSPNNKPLINQDVINNSRGERANPADFIHLFENNSERLVEFLEYLIQTSHKWQPLVYNTLVEHYLQIWSKLSDAATRVQWEQRIVRLLEFPDAKYDRHQTLILCQAVNFRPGVLYLYEENKLYQQILQYHMSQQDYQSVLACCRRFGLQDPSLWVQALWAGAKDIDMPSHLLTEILNIIEKERLLSPLLVVDALSNWNAVKVGDIRSYLQSVLHAEEKMTDQEQARITKYTDETVRIRKHINNIQNSAIVFQGSRCCACNHQLELPSVHFLCQHSFHQHCFQSFSENENECPACLPNNKQIMDFIKAQEQGRDLHETFHSQLDKAVDGFTLVADYFGRGVFNKLTIINDSSFRPVGKITNDVSLPISSITENDKNTTLTTMQKEALKNIKTAPEQTIPTKPRRETPKSSVNRLNQSEPASSYQQPLLSQGGIADSISQALPSPIVPTPKPPVSLNPFEEDDYPAAYNPFESDGDDGTKNWNRFPS